MPPGGNLRSGSSSLTTPVPIVLISGGTPDAAHLQHYQPVAFLPKPFAIDDLLEVVERHVGIPTTPYGY